ncbi:MAG: helix-turn-helix transcriptional regulator [Nitriliruptor sp.]
MNLDRQQSIGARLRSVRAQQGLSLAQVEQRSEGRWKAVVVGAYERGARAITVERLAALALFYDVPVTHLLPDVDSQAEQRRENLLLDLVRLAAHDGSSDAIGVVARFARRVQLLRGDHGGQVLSLRDADVHTIALAAGIDPEELQAELRGRGLTGASG